MAVVLAYMRPSATFSRSARCSASSSSRGHQIHVRTLDSGWICVADWDRGRARRSGSNPCRATTGPPVARCGWSARQSRFWCVGPPSRWPTTTPAIRRVEPDVLLVDANCWGAMSTAETQAIPARPQSIHPVSRQSGLPPVRAGAPPCGVLVGRVRDLGIRTVTSSIFYRPFRDGINPVRAALRFAGALVGRLDAPRSGCPRRHRQLFEYVHTERGVGRSDMIGPAIFSATFGRTAGVVDDIELPVVLVTTSSVRQADAVLVRTALRADGRASARRRNASGRSCQFRCKRISSCDCERVRAAHSGPRPRGLRGDRSPSTTSALRKTSSPRSTRRSSTSTTATSSPVASSRSTATRSCSTSATRPRASSPRASCPSSTTSTPTTSSPWATRSRPWSSRRRTRRVA